MQLIIRFLILRNLVVQYSLHIDICEFWSSQNIGPAAPVTSAWIMNRLLSYVYN